MSLAQVIDLAEARRSRCRSAPQPIFRPGDDVEWIDWNGARRAGRVIGLCSLMGEPAANLFRLGWAPTTIELRRLSHAGAPIPA